MMPSTTTYSGGESHHNWERSGDAALVLGVNQGQMIAKKEGEEFGSSH
jgi:hypothetical protein